MKTVQAIIDLFGGPNKFPALKIENEGWMPLCIERIGRGPRGGLLVSVAHYFTQNGDLMADPEIVYEVIDTTHAKGDWWPISYKQDGLGTYQEAVYRDESERLLVNPKLVRDLRSFSRLWDKNLKDQGFLDAAKAKAAKA